MFPYHVVHRREGLALASGLCSVVSRFLVQCRVAYVLVISRRLCSCRRLCSAVVVMYGPRPSASLVLFIPLCTYMRCTRSHRIPRASAVLAKRASCIASFCTPCLTSGKRFRRLNGRIPHRSLSLPPPASARTSCPTLRGPASYPYSNRGRLPRSKGQRQAPQPGVHTPWTPQTQVISRTL